MPDFSTTVWGVPDPENNALAAQCDPFWTAMNGGFCSDSMGNFIRKNGSLVTVEEIVRGGAERNAQQWLPGVSNSLLLGGLALVVVLMMTRGRD